MEIMIGNCITGEKYTSPPKKLSPEAIAWLAEVVYKPMIEAKLGITLVRKNQQDG